MDIMDRAMRIACAINGYGTAVTFIVKKAGCADGSSFSACLSMNRDAASALARITRLAEDTGYSDGIYLGVPDGVDFRLLDRDVLRSTGFLDQKTGDDLLDGAGLLPVDDNVFDLTRWAGTGIPHKTGLVVNDPRLMTTLSFETTKTTAKVVLPGYELPQFFDAGERFVNAMRSAASPSFHP